VELDSKNTLKLLLAGKAPAGLRIKGDLSLAGTRIRSLPADLVVTGHLDLGKTPRLQGIGAGLRVGGNLFIGGKSSKNWTPDGPSIGRTPYCPTPISALPEGLKVAGSLVLTSCPNLAALPTQLGVGQALQLRDCPSLERLPQGLAVGTDLHLHGLPRLETLPEGLTVGRDLTIVGTKLRELSASLQVGRHLRLIHCSRFTGAGLGSLAVHGDLELVAYRGEGLPGGIDIQGELRIQMAKSLRSLPKPMRVFGGLHIRECKELSTFAAPISVEQDLIIPRRSPPTRSSPPRTPSSGGSCWSARASITCSKKPRPV
jgi:hypothetical protein